MRSQPPSRDRRVAAAARHGYPTADVGAEESALATEMRTAARGRSARTPLIVLVGMGLAVPAFAVVLSLLILAISRLAE